MNHSLWLAGFRPFFILGFISGAALPLIWALAFLGWLPLPRAGLAPVQWHAHEMLYGFGWAIMGGFLLTASKNWVKIRGLHGAPLAIAAGLWVTERIALLSVPDSAPVAVRFVLLNLFLIYVAGYVLWTLLRYRKQDSFKDNFFFVVALPLFLLAKNMTLSTETYVGGVAMSIGLFRLAFAVMFERTMTQFMKNKFGAPLYRNPFLDYSIKGLILIAAFQAFLPTSLSVWILAVAATLLFVRLTLWKPLQGLRDFGIGIMYIGYLGLTLHFFTEALRLSGLYSGVGSLSVHVFTFLCMGLVIPGMMIRISQGHTGRPLLFTASDRFAIGMIGSAAFFRLIATQFWPENYFIWIALSSVGWTLGFVVLGYRLIPFLLRPRADGRIH